MIENSGELIFSSHALCALVLIMNERDWWSEARMVFPTPRSALMDKPVVICSARRVNLTVFSTP